MSCFSLAFGIGSQNLKDQWLEVFYPKPLLNPPDELLTALQIGLNLPNANCNYVLQSEQAQMLAEVLQSIDREQAALLIQLAQSDKPLVATVLLEDSAPASTPEAYLKLHLLSHRQVLPHGVNLVGIFALLPNVAWTNEGAIDLAELPARQLAARLAGRELSVFSVDKFPKMTDYVVPSGVRIADTGVGTN